MILEGISKLADLIFWLFLFVAIWKYDVFGRLPAGLQITLYTAVGISGIAGLLSRWL